MVPLIQRSKALVCAFLSAILLFVLGAPLSAVSAEPDNEWSGKAVLVSYKMNFGGKALKPLFRCSLYGQGVSGELVLKSLDPSMSPIAIGTIRRAGRLACDNGVVEAELKAPAAPSLPSVPSAPLVPTVQPAAQREPAARQAREITKPDRPHIAHSVPDELHTLGDPGLVWSYPKEDSVQGLEDGAAMAKVHVALPKGVFGPPQEVSTHYICRNGSTSQGEIKNPSFDIAVAREQIRRSRDVCGVIRRECLDSGLRLGRKDVSEWLNRPETSCEEAKKMSAAVEEYPYGVSISSRCFLSSGDREVFNRNRSLAQRERINQYMAEKSCGADQTADSHTKTINIPYVKIIGKASPGGAEANSAIND